MPTYYQRLSYLAETEGACRIQIQFKLCERANENSGIIRVIGHGQVNWKVVRHQKELSHDVCHELGWRGGDGSRSSRLSQWQADMLWVMHSGNSHKGHTKWHLAALSLALLSLSLSLLRPIICLLRLPDTACVISHTAFSPANAPPTDNQRAKRAITVTFLRCNVSASYPTYRQNPAVCVCVCVPPGKSIKMYFTVNVYNFLFFFFLLPEEERYVKDLLGC